MVRTKASGKKRTKPTNGISKVRTRHNGHTPAVVEVIQEPLQKRRYGSYQPWMIKEAQELVGKLGARNVDLAEFFGVCEATIDNWIQRKREFNIAVRKGRLEAQLKVSQALYHKAIGYSHPDVHISNYKGEITVTDITKHYPPDAYAAHKYLTIMFRDVWADVSNMNVNHQHSGEITHRKIEELSMEDLPEEVKNFIFDLNIKQLSDVQHN